MADAVAREGSFSSKTLLGTSQPQPPGLEIPSAPQSWVLELGRSAPISRLHSSPCARFRQRAQCIGRQRGASGAGVAIAARLVAKRRDFCPRPRKGTKLRQVLRPACAPSQAAWWT
eukprot:scaffold24_cov245-Pinguiococcus_pyrenoidosus.AAC.25